MGSKIPLAGGGQLFIREENGLVCFEAVRPDDGRGLYKVWLRGGAGRMLLGTLVPEGGGLRLCRRVSKATLERGGCWPVSGGECVMAFAFEKEAGGWRQENCPERLFKDESLRHMVAGRGVLLRRETDGFCLGVRFDPGRPFPFAPLFCLARVEQVQGTLHALFCFDRDGNPLVPHNTGKSGENSGVS